MNLAPKFHKRAIPIILICIVAAACGVAPTQEPIVFEFAKTETAIAHPTTAVPILTPTQAPPTSTPVITEPEPGIDWIISSLEGLPIDQFFDASYTQLLLRKPELLTELNLSEQFGLRDNQLNNLSDAYLKDTQRLESTILELLLTYDRQSLTPDQQLSYDIYRWMLEDLVQGHQFMYHNYLLTPMINSYDFNLTTLLTELHPLKDRQDVEDYIQRLAQVDHQVGQVLEGLTIREELGIIPPDFILAMARSNLADYIGLIGVNREALDPSYIPVFTVFSESLQQIPELSAEEKTEFQAAAFRQVEDSFIPGYLKLIDYLDYLQPLADNEAGAWKLPDGDAYYQYKLHQETSTNMTPDEIHNLGLLEVDRIRSEMREVFTQLGYPQDEEFGLSLRRAMQEGGVYDISTTTGKDVYVAAVEKIISDADQRMHEVFDIGPSWGVEVVPGPIGGYYIAGAPDGSRPGAYHVGVSGYQVNKFTQATTAYHEAVPGHHYQIATAQALDLPMFRKGGGMNGFVEGWALYAERLAYEMGLYDDDPYGNLGRLQMELLRAVRLVADTGIHAKRWTRLEARDYIDQATGAPGYFSHEADRYIVMPAQATGYKVGMLKILELRQRAQEALGDQFDIKEFHNTVIGNGNLPLEVLEQLVEAYIVDAQSQ